MVSSGIAVTLWLRNQFVHREIRLGNATRAMAGALRRDMSPLVDQDMGDGLIHRITAALLIQTGSRRTQELRDACAIDRNKGLNLPGNQQYPAERSSQEGAIWLREHITATQQLN